MTDRVVRATAVLALVLIVGGIALWFFPAGMVAAGVAILALLTFNPAAARRLSWPR